MMKLSRPKRWLAIGALVLLTPIISAAKPDRGKGCGFHDQRRCRQVPDGGSTASYLLAVGGMCLGAMLIRSQASKTDRS